ncbi:hypothetical protein JXO52_06885 [bacterium]|nr:hypothetical protein [bacterium]
MNRAMVFIKKNMIPILVTGWLLLLAVLLWNVRLEWEAKRMITFCGLIWGYIIWYFEMVRFRNSPEYKPIIRKRYPHVAGLTVVVLFAFILSPPLIFSMVKNGLDDFFRFALLFTVSFWSAYQIAAGLWFRKQSR